MNESYISNFLMSKIGNPYGVAGLMGNLYAESGLNFNIVERLCIKRLKENGKGEWTDETYTAAVDNGTISRAEFLNPLPNRCYGFGLVQWTTTTRKARLYDRAKQAGKSIADPDVQLDYLIYELQTYYPAVWNTLIKATSVREASDIVLDKFECPADRSEAVRVKRAGYGQKYYDEIVRCGDMGTLDSLIARGIAEEGYVEKASNKDLDSKTGNKGTGNYTKYARDVNAAGLMGCQAQAWCCTFQFWLDLMEFGVDKALANWNMTPKSYVGYNCFSTYNAFKKAGKVGMEPRLGAVVIFNFSHAGRVVKIYEKNGRKVWDCLEGNTSSNLNDRNGGQVKIKTRDWSDPTVKGFCYIDYATEPETYPKWVHSGNDWYYRLSEGANAHGWQKIRNADGKVRWYFFNPDGKMATGWFTVSGYKYYAEESGDLAGALYKSDESGAQSIWVIE